MRITLQPAFLLHSRPYRETSMLLEFFTEDYGRIAAVARGVRTSRSPLRSLLQPFTPLLISWQGKSDLMRLISVEPKEATLDLRGECLFGGLYLNELLIKLLQKQDPYRDLYRVYQQTLVELQQKKLQQKTLRLFEKKLLDEMGYGLQLNQDAEKFYYYFIEHGFEEVQSEKHYDNAMIFSGKHLLQLANETLDDEESLLAAKKLMRLVITHILGEKNLESRKLFMGIT